MKYSSTNGNDDNSSTLHAEDMAYEYIQHQIGALFIRNL